MITIKNLSYAYHKQRMVYENFSLEFSEGHIHGLLSSNGVGKTTLLKLLSGLLIPTSGQITIDGLDPSQRSIELLSEVFFFPEEIHMPPISLKKYVKVNKVFYPRFSDKQFASNCRELEIDPTASLNHLSTGLLKRAVLAFALACNTRYLFFDEPTNGLDIPSKSVFRRLLAQWLTPERTIILSTHQIKEVESLIDNVVICDHEGLILNAGTDLLSERFLFGKLPPTAQPFYTEVTPTGTIGIAPNDEGLERQPNIELLFNATIAHRAEIIHHLSNHPNIPSHE